MSVQKIKKKEKALYQAMYRNYLVYLIAGQEQLHYPKDYCRVFHELLHKHNITSLTYIYIICAFIIYEYFRRVLQLAIVT